MPDHNASLSPTRTFGWSLQLGGLYQSLLAPPNQLSNLLLPESHRVCSSVHPAIPRPSVLPLLLLSRDPWLSLCGAVSSLSSSPTIAREKGVRGSCSARVTWHTHPEAANSCTPLQRRPTELPVTRNLPSVHLPLPASRRAQGTEGQTFTSAFTLINIHCNGCVWPAQ